MRLLTICVSVAALAISSTAISAPKSAHSDTSKKTDAPLSAKALSPPDFKAMLAIFDKLFPPQPDPDPARLALARTSVQAMWPDGAYGKLMTGFMGGMFDRVMQMKQSDFAALDTRKPKNDAVATKANLSLHDQAAAKDPYFDQRAAAIRAAVTEEFGKISVIVDPKMREGLARAMARQFDQTQLNDINKFFATTTGREFAGKYFQLWLDPDTLRSMMGTLPEMMNLMPGMVQKIEEANNKFPKPPKPAKPASTADKK